MSKGKVAILVFPGTNSEEETLDACVAAGLDARLSLWSDPPSDLPQYAAFVLPGGFAFEDRVRAGAVASKSHAVEVVAEQAARGKLVLGLCNGAQVLAEAGLLGPVAIARNLPARHFQNRFVDVELSAPPERCAFTNQLVTGGKVRMAMAHAEGRFCGDASTFDALEREGRITFKYTGGAANGAMHAAAGVCNEAGNVLALMPHPERAAWAFNLAFADLSFRSLEPATPTPALGIFRSMAASLAAGP